jgi:hypothetical protein
VSQDPELTVRTTLCLVSPTRYAPARGVAVAVMVVSHGTGVVIVIHVVAPDVAVVWLLEQADLPPATECLCPLGTYLGWCTIEGLCTARDAGTERIGQMSLQQCEVTDERYRGRRIAAVRCGEFALVIQGGWEAEATDDLSGESLLLAPTVRTERVGWTHASDLLTALSGRGPMPPPQPVPVIRGCRATVNTVACGWWAKLPPLPSPCPNPNLITHSFV